jgi:hypothetical protein
MLSRQTLVQSSRSSVVHPAKPTRNRRLFDWVPTAVGLVIGLSQASCCPGVQCGACPTPGISVSVTDASQLPIGTATVKANGMTCPLQPGSAGFYLCDVTPGEYMITVSAATYQSQSTTYQLLDSGKGACCSCGAVGSTTVILTQ